jgi:ABC-type transport system involved in multi-copper enzyme maturation permease subunit
MVWWIASFELRKRLAMLSTYVYFAVFLACGIFLALAMGGAFSSLASGAGSEKIHANAPFVVSDTINSLSNIGVLMSAAVFGQAVHQDFEAGTSHLFFTMPIRKRSYLTGRFLGALLFVLLIFTSLGLGVLLGSLSPVFVDRALFGPFRLASFLWPYVTFVVPNAIFTGGLFFALGTLTRKMMPVYVGAVVLALGYLAAGAMLSDVENKSLAAMLDPFGGSAAAGVVRYWTTWDKNNRLLPLAGLLLANRALWLSVGLGALGLTYAKFSFSAESPRDRPGSPGDELAAPPPDTGPLPSSVPHRGAGVLLMLLARSTWLELVETVKSVYFGIFILAGGILALIVTHVGSRLFGSPVWPVTSVIADYGVAGFALFILIIVTVYAGEVVWRERDLHFDQIVDALPVPTWVPCLAKLLALCVTPALVLAAVPVFGVCYQTAYGYHHYELGLYFEWLYGFYFPHYVFLCVLAFTMQSVLQHKYLGHFAMVGFYLFQAFQGKLGLEHRLLRYASIPHPTYSDMNGFGHFVKPMVFYDLYWTGFAIVLATCAQLFWTRGTEAPWRARLRVARSRFTLGPIAFCAGGLLLAGGMGGAIYYESDVLNRFRTSREEETLRADYEKTYKKIEGTPQPRITDVKVDFDIYPEDETLDARGTYQIANHSTQAIQTVYVELASDQPYRKLAVGGVERPKESNVAMGLYTFELPSPLLPGASIPLEFDIRFHDRGFKDDGNRTDICANGTFFNSFNLPHLGYDRHRELSLDNDRKKYGLPPRDRLPDLRDAKGLENNLVSWDADWVTFESTVSTTPDQIAVVPGYLEKEWTENSRRFFHYKMNAKILDFFSVLSARYEVRRDVWTNTLGAAGAPSPEVKLEIYYHPGHEYDLDEMMRGLKDTLTYDTAAFGPYQHRQARILEFPRYEMFAQSFPNTIPWSEGTGFINRVEPTRDTDVDLPYYGAGHELSHQWWAHQVIGGNVQGATLLDETLAEYSAFMILKKRFGAENMRRFLRYEMDQYLRGRAMEQKREVPLERVEDQFYIRYNKGAVVMYALEDYIGEDAMNVALRAFLNAYEFKGPPYPNALALVDELRKVTPPEMQYVIHDLFETITLYDNRALSAAARKLDGGKYEITVKVSAKKMQAGEQGEETEVPMDDLVDIGGLDEKNAALGVQRQRVKGGESEVKIVMDRLPAKVGIDPLNKLIDRHPEDNVVAVDAP